MSEDKVYVLSGGATDTLIALIERGPLEDGNVPSKSGRDELMELGLAARIVIGGWHGHQAATYSGASYYCNMYNAETIAEAKANRIAKNLMSTIGVKTL